MRNFCDKREQLSLLKLPSGAKITTEGNNEELRIEKYLYSVICYLLSVICNL